MTDKAVGVRVTSGRNAETGERAVAIEEVDDAGEVVNRIVLTPPGAERVRADITAAMEEIH